MKGGYVVKSKNETKVLNQDLELINKLTRRKLSEDEVYVFSLVLCDNDIDRDYERFTDDALEKLAELFVGKTGILDHNPTSGNQTARIYSCHTEIVMGKTNRLKMPYKRLVAKAYMPRSEKNENIILEIDSGIKKEVSVGCLVGSRICSVCSNDNNKEPCAHIKGRRYKSNGVYEICHTILDNPVDAYEWSFVAVPAQREAGVIKAFDSKKNGGERKMEDIIKNLSQGQQVTLSEPESQKLLEFIGALKQQAEVGEIYKAELKRDVLKLSAIVQPEISSSLMEGVVKKMTIEELKSFKDSFKAKAANIMPVKPQFAAQELQSSKNQNTQFKI